MRKQLKNQDKRKKREGTQETLVTQKENKMIIKKINKIVIKCIYKKF